MCVYMTFYETLYIHLNIAVFILLDLCTALHTLDKCSYKNWHTELTLKDLH